MTKKQIIKLFFEFLREQGIAGVYVVVFYTEERYDYFKTGAKEKTLDSFLNKTRPSDYIMNLCTWSDNDSANWNAIDGFWKAKLVDKGIN
jgi:CTP:phosphocholine cytidylyltransferase-like protein